MPYLVFIASLIATLNILLYRKQDNQWWSNNFSTAMSILLMLASAALILKYNIPKYSIPLIFFISIAGGFIQSLQITFC
jgi:phosphate starvation-inducible membrane PsiE